MADKEEFKTRAVIKKVRFSYCNLLEPTAFGNEEPRYRTDIIIPKADIKNIEAVKFAISEAIRKAQQTGKPLAGKDLKKAKATGKWHSALKDGDIERPEDEVYKNAYFLSAWKAQDDGQPDIIDLTNKYITKDTPNASDRIYSGCYVTISVSFFGYEKGGNMGTGCNVGNVFTFERGEKLGGKIDAQSEFADDIKEAQEEASLPDDGSTDASDDDLF